MSQSVVLLDLKPARAKKLIAEIIPDSGRVFFTHHAQQRMKERKINSSQVFCCLKHGNIVEGPYQDVKGFWNLAIETVSAGDIIKVVIAFSKNNSGETIIVVTVI